MWSTSARRWKIGVGEFPTEIHGWEGLEIVLMVDGCISMLLDIVCISWPDWVFLSSTGTSFREAQAGYSVGDGAVTKAQLALPCFCRGVLLL